MSSATDSEAAAPLVDVFVSYARTDDAIVEPLVETLRDEGFDVWFDKRVYAGAAWESMILGTLATAKAVLVVWSDSAVTRPWVLREATIAAETNRMVPIRLDACSIPAEFDGLQTVDMTGWPGHGHHKHLELMLTGLTRLAPPSRIDTIRPGFNTGHLGPEVALPAVTGVGQEFRYLHFSVVLNPARRLAWYVAYNAAAGIDVQRGDRWMPDPTVPLAFQPQDEHFLGTGFDRGHVVSPRTVSWGEPRFAQIANRQAFFWTNTAPQVPKMNRQWWLAVERWERALADERGRLCGFAGPVLADDDPVHGADEVLIGRLRSRQNFRLPRSFWKVVVTTECAELRVAAFLWNQERLGRMRRPPTDAKSFRVDLAEVEQRAGIEFDPAVRAARPL